LEGWICTLRGVSGVGEGNSRKGKDGAASAPNTGRSNNKKGGTEYTGSSTGSLTRPVTDNGTFFAKTKRASKKKRTTLESRSGGHWGVGSKHSPGRERDTGIMRKKRNYYVTEGKGGNSIRSKLGGQMKTQEKMAVERKQLPIMWLRKKKKTGLKRLTGNLGGKDHYSLEYR